MSSSVVLIHGLGGSTRRTWQETGWLDLLGDLGRTVHTVELPGHGAEPLTEVPLHQHLLDRLPEGTVDAVGFSLGARTLLAAAGLEPQRFGRLVLAGVGANLFADDGQGRQLADAIAGDGDTNPVVRYFRGQATADDVDPRAVSVLLGRANDLALTEEHLSAVTMPVLVVLGDEDFAGPPEPLVDRLPDARLVTLRGVDHFATPKNFGFLDAALEWLAAP